MLSILQFSFFFGYIFINSKFEIKSIKIFSEDNNVKAFTISNKMFF